MIMPSLRRTLPHLASVALRTLGGEVCAGSLRAVEQLARGHQSRVKVERVDLRSEEAQSVRINRAILLLTRLGRRGREVEGPMMREIERRDVAFLLACLRSMHGTIGNRDASCALSECGHVGGQSDGRGSFDCEAHLKVEGALRPILAGAVQQPEHDRGGIARRSEELGRGEGRPDERVERPTLQRRRVGGNGGQLRRCVAAWPGAGSAVQTEILASCQRLPCLTSASMPILL
jgi:hypothetical protein